jgi:hypothetical protein
MAKNTPRVFWASDALYLCRRARPISFTLLIEISPAISSFVAYRHFLPVYTKSIRYQYLFSCTIAPPVAFNPPSQWSIARRVDISGRMDNIRIVHKRKTNKLHNRDGQRSQKEETKSGGANQVDQWGTDNSPSRGSASIPLTKALQRGVVTVTVGSSYRTRQRRYESYRKLFEV